ncbi:conserved hypothetical protein [Deferribacter desulfuricans SSM1]|uniref:Pyruvate formate-lyase activating enzyme n=1 Tax=Deferribacter desulfuricans (strain DSM 14783 / JCM 11476 / NBRC 101012 / SSM1) TaxID=639282 RepID=D3PCY7_DEFDS|nr:DUF1786 family protein [Deferribacter desulfuricans]BAI80460.1 conserved hypothetical protein [Deferribacter desulfuricans SSM1]
MAILSIDIGLGTADYLLFERGKKPENFIKLILPSPTNYFSKKIKECSGDLTVGGYTIGGGFVNRALKNYLKSYNVILSKTAARTVSDNLDEVLDDGFKVVEDIVNPDIFFCEIDKKKLDFIEEISNTNIYKILVAAQDHGYEEGKSDRVVRINFLKEFLAEGLLNAKFEAQDDIPNNFTRWNSLKNQLEDLGINKYAISDTSVVAALGASYVSRGFPCITVDVGNGHTFIALIDKDFKISAFIEHHTSMLNKDKIDNYIKMLCNYDVSHEDVYNDGGHGAHIYFKIPGIELNNIPVLVTGPRRSELFDFGENITFASPLGDVMITGNVGLLMQQSLL